MYACMYVVHSGHAQALYGVGTVVASQLLLVLGACVVEGVRLPLGVLVPRLVGLVFDPESPAGGEDHEETWCECMFNVCSILR